MAAVLSPLGCEVMCLQEMGPRDSRAWKLHLFFFLIDLCVWVFCLPECMSVNYVPAWCPHGQEEGVESAETGVTDSCDLPCGY